MYVLKWITHPVYLLIAIVVVAFFLNRDALFGNSPEQPAAAGTAAARGSDVPARVMTAADGAQAVTDLAASEPVASSGTAQPAKPADAADGRSATNTARKLWRQARMAAWRGELETSVDLYRQFAEQVPDSIDAFGEMGNVLMRMGQWDAAADAYGQAAVRAKDGGHIRTAWYLHSVVAGLDPDQAAELRETLSAAD